MSALINFSKRHKKKLIFTIVFFGGGYCGVKYAIYKLKEVFLLSLQPSSLLDSQTLSMRKNEHYLSIKNTSDQGVLSLVKSMQKKINEDLSSEGLLEQLKQKPANKLAIWETLKIRCIAKCLTNIYATTLLSLFTKIELNIIGAYLFLSNSMENSENEKEMGNTTESWSVEFIEQQENTLSSQVQQKFLENIENFVNKGLPVLTEIITGFCEEAFKEVNLKESLNVEFISQKIESIQKKIEDYVFSDSLISNEWLQDNFFVKYMLPDLNLNDKTYSLVVWNDNKKMRSDDDVLFSLNLETYDLLTSTDFKKCMQSLTKTLSNEFLNTLTSQLVQHLVDPSNLKNNSEKDISIPVSMPFAKLVPILNKTNSVFELDSLRCKMLKDSNMNIFSANIYEGFSVPKKQKMVFDNENESMTNSIVYNKDSMLNQVF